MIRLAVMLYVKYPLSLRNVEDLLGERGIDISYETVRYWVEPVRPTVSPRYPPTGEFVRVSLTAPQRKIHDNRLG